VIWYYDTSSACRVLRIPGNFYTCAHLNFARSVLLSWHYFILWAQWLCNLRWSGQIGRCNYWCRNVSDPPVGQVCFESMFFSFRVLHTFWQQRMGEWYWEINLAFWQGRKGRRIRTRSCSHSWNYVTHSFTHDYWSGREAISFWNLQYLKNSNTSYNWDTISLVMQYRNLICCY